VRVRLGLCQTIWQVDWPAMSVAQVRTASAPEVLREALARLDAGGRVVVATVLRRRGSAPSTPGQKLALLTRDEALGTVGGGAVEREVLAAMQRAFDGGKCEPEIVRHELGASLGMCCGGAVEVLIEPMEASVRVLVVGAGHVGAALAPILAGLGFRVVVADPRDGALAARGLASGPNLVALGLEHDDDEVLAALGDPSAAIVLVMTHDHQLDQEILEWALGLGARFVGGVGSRAKAARTRQRLEAKGFVEADIERVRMPLGLAIGARSPGEIAISIAAEVVSLRAAWVAAASREVMSAT